MRRSLTRGGIVAAASLVLGLAACGAETETPTRGQEGAVEVVEESGSGESGGAGADAGAGGGETPAVPGAGGVESGGGAEGDYAFGTNRDEIARAVSETYSTADATARWEGDTLVVSMDGDVDGALAGWTECRAVTQLVDEGDSVAIVYPNGRLECAEVLAP